MQQAPYLEQGSTIGIVCPSGYLQKDRIEHAIRVLQQWGFHLKVGKAVGSAHHYFAGTDEERKEDLQEMLDDPTIDAILMGRGGYGLSRIIDDIDFAAFKNKPKWICGFSDVTVLHSHIQSQLNIATLHSPMCIAFKTGTEDTEHIRNFHDALVGKALSYNITASGHNRPGTATGIMTGGNLSLLAHLTGSVSEVSTDGKILFIEDTGEYLYNIDRLMLHLKRAGKLDNLAALLVGNFDNMKDGERPFRQSIEEIVLDKVKGYDYPVCFNFPAGHTEVNFTLTFGIKHKLTVDTTGGRLELMR